MRLTPWLRGLLTRSRVLTIVLLAAFAPVGGARAETIGGALTKAYLSNPDIGRQRAAVRATDEDVSKAEAGYRPRATAEGDLRPLQVLEKQFPAGGERTTAGRANAYGQESAIRLPRPEGYNLKVYQDLWNANRTTNLVRRADSLVLAARELLRNTEQNVLLDGAAAYMDVMRDAAVLELVRAHVHVLDERLQEAKDRFTAGEVTQTDIAQVEARRAAVQASASTAQSTLQASIAEYRRVIGDEPHRLDPAKPLKEQLPATLDEAIAISQAEHPAIAASLFGVDTAALDVKVAESRLSPSAVLEGLIDKRYKADAQEASIPFTASTRVLVNAPVYDGGKTYASVRQAKELLDQQELQVDVEREKVRAAVVSVWGRNQNAAGLIDAATAHVAAAVQVVNGVREEARLGQRTTLEELDAEQLLLKARIQLVFAQRDQIVSSYELLSAIGRLSTTQLGLAVTPYNPAIHLKQVEDKWIGLRTPDGH
jgi:outer membrane protein